MNKRWFATGLATLGIAGNLLAQAPNGLETIVTQNEQVIENPIKESEENIFDYKEFEEEIRKYEGVKYQAYDDSLGIRTIGVGFNLERKDARKKMATLGLNYDSVYSGSTILDENQVSYLLKEDLEIAVKDAEKYVGKGQWEKLDMEAKEVVANMSYNLGLPRLSKFVKLKEALIREDYQTAAAEMQDSKWYKQVGKRGKDLVEKMRTVGLD